jgi:hypothetical protein
MKKEGTCHDPQGGQAVAADEAGVNRGARGFLLAFLAAALLAGCTAGQVQEFFYAGGKVAYDSLRARQQAD